MQEVKVSVRHQGKDCHVAESMKKNHFFLSESIYYTFPSIHIARTIVEGNNFFGIPKDKFKAEAGNAAWPLFGQIDGLWLDEAGSLGMHIDVDQESKSGILKQGAEANGLHSVSRKELKPYQKKAIESMRAGGTIVIKECQPDASSVKGMVSCSVSVSKKLDALEAENKRLNKELAKQIKESTKKIVDLQEANRNKKPTVDEALDVLAEEYLMKPVEVYEAIRRFHDNSCKPEEAKRTLQPSEVGDQFCLEMSKKIADFILDDKRRKLVGVMSIEKAAGIPTSTISNFISAKRDRIPLHHIGSIVKVLEVLGFKA